MKYLIKFYYETEFGVEKEWIECKDHDHMISISKKMDRDEVVYDLYTEDATGNIEELNR